MNAPQSPHWERRTLEKIALEGIKEQRRARRWNLFFKILFFVYLTIIVVSLFLKADRTPKYDAFGQTTAPVSKAHIALIRLNGVIAADKAANAEDLSSLLRQAASKDTVKGILLLANSPGGSPVQSSIVYKTIEALKKQYKKPILTVVTDTCASGCYYIVSASDEIYADESSIVGSIGVISQSYGYGEAAKKLGIDPRTFTAGENKDFMNPARPMTASEIAFLKNLLDDLHHHFIDAVKAGRGERLTDNADLFSGLFWTGEKAQSLGLIDGIATPVTVARKIGDYPIYDYSASDPIEKVLKRFGAEAQQAVSSGIDEVMTPQNHFELR